MVLPIGVVGLFTIISGCYALYKIAVLGRRDKTVCTSHVNPMIAACLVLCYFLYLYLTRTLLDVFNCAPTAPPDGKLYMQAVFEECGIPGGTQVTLLPIAVVGFIVYTAGYPVGMLTLLWRNRETVMEDQLLRAKGVGFDRLTNPRAYDFRRRYQRSYYQFKPDYAYFWIVVIIVRKFFIAVTSILFNRNGAFQMAACLLVMFLAYALQVRYTPYMSPSDCDDVLRDHETSRFQSKVHAVLHARLAEVSARGRKRVHKNLLTFEGKVDRSAVLGVMAGWLFNYNTVEAVMSFAAVVRSRRGVDRRAPAAVVLSLARPPPLPAPPADRVADGHHVHGADHQPVLQRPRSRRRHHRHRAHRHHRRHHLLCHRAGDGDGGAVHRVAARGRRQARRVQAQRQDGG